MTVIIANCIAYLCDSCDALTDPILLDEDLELLSWSEDDRGQHRCPHCTALQEPT